MEGIQIFANRVGVKNDITLLTLKGVVDTNTSRQLVKIIDEILQEHICQLIIDLGSVTYISSAGWGVFVGEIKGIREEGGDLKIVHMTPEVQEVFEMLEFHRILKSYESIEEAMNEFDLLRGLDITKGEMKKVAVPLVKEVPLPSFPPRPTITPHGSLRTSRYRLPQTKAKVNEANLPLHEKIKLIITENPLLGAWGIRKALRGERFNNTKIGWFKLRSLLKQLNLDTKTKRYRFYRAR